jgi:hypothetical protein
MYDTFQTYKTLLGEQDKLMSKVHCKTIKKTEIKLKTILTCKNKLMHFYINKKQTIK